MAQHINGLIVSASNSSKKQRGSVTIRAQTGEIVARIYSDHSKPLQWLRKWPKSPERIDLVKQMEEYGLSPIEINAIVSM